MKREVWVECEESDPNASYWMARLRGHAFFKKITLNEARWVDVKERLPDAGKEFFCYGEGGFLIEKSTENGFSEDVTHWLEGVPEVPKIKEDWEVNFDKYPKLNNGNACAVNGCSVMKCDFKAVWQAALASKQEGEVVKVLNPSTSLLCKLASIAVHAEEMISNDGHEK